MRLVMDLYGKSLSGNTRHPQTVMRDLGIQYLNGIPQPMFDAWEFIQVDPSTVPQNLPDWISQVEPDA